MLNKEHPAGRWIKAKKIWKYLQSQNGYACDDPDYTYEKEGKIWRAALHIQVLEEDDLRT